MNIRLMVKRNAMICEKVSSNFVCYPGWCDVEALSYAKIWDSELNFSLLYPSHNEDDLGHGGYNVVEHDKAIFIIK